jgi:phospholipid/cholesterol/gamma-HCH transport system substrate-binding protein
VAMSSAKAVGAGVFVLGGVLLFAVILFTIGDRRMLFEQRFPLYVELAQLGQLQPGAIVRVAGLDAGSVTDIQVPRTPSEPFRVRLEVREDLRHLVRTDSVATTQTEGLVGAVFVNISVGSDAATPMADGGTIPGRDPFSMVDLLEQASETVTVVNETAVMLRDDLERTLQTAALTVDDLHGLLHTVRPDLVAMTRHGSRVAGEAEELMLALNEGRGTIGQLIHDDTLALQLRGLMDEAQLVMDNIRELSGDARRALADFTGPDGPTQGMMGDVRVAMREAREATAALADNMDALRHNFLFRGFFNRRGYYDLNAISPVEYREGLLEDRRRRVLRIWLDAAVLFEAGADGTEQLTPGGLARVDAAMATYLPFLPSSPIIVEGYATAGSVQERYHVSRLRARMVREHLLARHDLRPQHTASIGLADEAEDDPSETGRWDGIALTLVVDRDELRLAAQK